MRRHPPLIPLALLGACLLGVLFVWRWHSADAGLAGESRADSSPDERGANMELESSDPSAPPPPETAAAAPRAAAEGGFAAGADSTEPVPEARIDGLVLRPDGKPAALARVQFTQWRNDRGPEDQPEDSTLTDEQGHFTIDPAPVGNLRLVAMHDEFSPSQPNEFALAAGEHKRNLRLELREYGRIRGLVLDAHNVARAKPSLVCEDMTSRKALFAEGDAAGRFEFTKVVAGYQLVSLKLTSAELEDIRADAPFLANILGRGDLERFVEVAPGATVEVVLGGIPAEGVRVFGRVHSGETPLARTWIWAEDRAADWGRGPRARSDEFGAYELWVSEPGPYKFHLIAAGGTLDLARGAQITEKHEQALDFDLPGGSIFGHVVDGSGRPVTEVSVGLQASASPDPAAAQPFELWGPHGTVDAQGRFRFTHLSAGRYVLDATPLSKPDAETRFARARLGGLVLDAGTALGEVEIVLRPGCKIRGVVRGAPEGLAGSLRVFAHDLSGGSTVASARVDSDGGFVLSGLSEGAFVLRATGAGLASQLSPAVHARAEREAEVELTVELGARLWVGARWAAGEQPSRLELVVRERNYIVFESNPDPSPGNRAYLVLAPGACVVEVSGPGGWQGSESVPLEAGKTSEVDVLLRRTK